jgi:hypothetical protein
VDSNMSLGLVGTKGDFKGDELGEISVAFGALDNIVTPVTGWDSITNLVEGVTGSNQETDTELRIRRASIDSIANGGVDEAIRTRILQDIDNVTDCVVISNRTNSVDINGRPAKSVEIIVEGGLDFVVAEKNMASYSKRY